MLIKTDAPFLQISWSIIIPVYWLGGIAVARDGEYGSARPCAVGR